MTPPQLPPHLLPAPPASPAPVARSPRTVPEFLAWVWAKPWARLIVYVLAGWLVWQLARQLTGVLVMVATAYAISYVVNPLVLYLEGRGLRRGLSISLMLILFLGVVGMLFWTVASQVTNLIGSVPDLIQRFPTLLEKTLHDHRDIPAVAQMTDKLMSYVREKSADITTNIGPITAQLLGGPNIDVMGKLAGVVGWLGQAVIVLTLALFFLSDHSRPGRMLLGLLPRQWQSTALRLSDDVSQSFGDYLRGQLMTGLVITVVAGLGLLLLKVPNALALGLLTGIGGLIPMFGMVLATVPALLQAIPQGTTTLLGVCLLYFAINQLAFNVVQPMIMGRTSNLNPAGILVAVLVGGSAGGLMGAFLAIPAAMLLQRWVARYWLHSPAHEGRQPAPPAVQPAPIPEMPERSSISLPEQN